MFYSRRIFAPSTCFLFTVAMLLSLSFSAFGRDGDLDRGFEPVLSQSRNSPGVNEVFPLPDSRMLVAGGFKVVNGVTKINLVRLNADGSLDNSFGVIFGSTTQFFGTSVRTVLAQPDGKLLVGGFFNTVNGIPANHLVRLTAAGEVDTTFNTGTGFSNAVTALALQPDGKIVAAGNFGSFNGVSRSYLARLNTDGSLDTSLNSVIASFWAETMKTVLLLPDGKIFIQGAFHSVNSSQRRGFAKLNSDGTLDATFVEPGTYSLFNGISTFAVRPDGKLYIGGFFEIRVSNQLVCQNLCRLNSDGTLDSSYFVPFPPNNTVRTIYLQSDGRLIVHGGYQTINGVSRDGTTRLNDNGSVDTSFNPAFTLAGGAISAFVRQSDGRYLIPGNFVTVNGTPAENLARIDADGNHDPTFAPHFSTLAYVVTATAVQPDGKILVSGDFNRANGTLRRRIARFHPDGTLDTSFNASVTNAQGTSGFDEVFDIILQPDGKILIGGYFARVNGEPHSYLARLNSDGTTDSAFNPVFNYEGSGGGYVRSITLQADGKIFVGGAFQTVNGDNRRNHARLNSDGTVDQTFAIPFDAAYSPSINDSLVQPDGKIVIGGDFRITGNATTYSVARLNLDGTLDGTFILSAEPNATPYLVYSVARQPDGKILVGGSWNFQSRPLVKRLNLNGTPDDSFNAGQIGNGFTSDRVYSIIPQSNGSILIAGGFTTVNGNLRPYVARLVDNGSFDYSFSVPQLRAENTSTQPTVYSMSQEADGDLVIAGYFDRVGTDFRSGFARLRNRHEPAFDFDGDGKTDIGIFRPDVAEWWINRSSNGSTFAAQFGATTDKLAPGDYTGDGKADIAIWRPATGSWFILRSEDSSFFSFPFGTNGDVPVPSDFDADGKADAAVFRPSNSTWYVRRSSDGGTTIETFGANGDVPVAADYDGDGKSDIAIYRPSAGQWWIKRSTAGVIAFTFGGSTDKPVQGDYTGDGKADVAFWRPSTGEWYILRSEDFGYYSQPFGTTGDVPAPGDYDGDGKFDPTVFRPSSATWFSNRSTAGTLIQQFGSSGDQPVANAFVP